MKRILNILYFIALFTAITFGQTAWYVNNTASGSNNGTSWANAWTSFSAINWASISAGDFVYISGGTDSLVYNAPLMPNCSGTSAKWITIAAGRYAPSPSGHSGRVIIDGNNYNEVAMVFEEGTGSNPNYIIFKGFETRKVAHGFYSNLDAFRRGVKIDSCMIYDFYSAGVRIETGEVGYQNLDSLFIENCRIISPNYISGESDGIQVKGASRVFIHNNYIRIPNQHPTQHVDAIQGYLGNGFVITNNVLINDSVNSPEGGGIPIILGSEGTNPVIIYNNYCYMGGVWQSGANWGGTLMTRWYDNNPMPPTWILHNTVVSNGPRVRGMWLEYATPTTTRVINNLIAQYSTTTNTVLSTFDNSTGSNLRVDSIRNNLFYRSWDSDVGFAGNLVGSGGSPTGSPSGWTDFVNNYGGTGIKGDPLLVNNIGYEPDQGILDWTLQEGSPATNQGENAEWYIDYLNTTYNLNGRLKWESANGVPRSSTPTIGAFEFDSGWTPPDTIPSFSFTGLNNRELNTAYTGSATFSGADSTFHVWTTTGARFNINSSSSLSTTMKTAVNGDVVYVENISSASYSTGTTETIVAGGVSRSFNVTTKSEPVLTSGTKKVRLSNGKVLKDSSGKVIKVQ